MEELYLLYCKFDLNKALTCDNIETAISKPIFSKMVLNALK